ncbi:MAG: hypothetical protein Q9M28_01620 [Mariprofundaceae bacterium]|nr:hypothetical protein [Mariprofundaceae bacterium]
MNQGFPDLSAETSHHDESFWPSFTDIMTVIMMIFLLAMLVLLMRNVDLIEQLKQSLQVQSQALTQQQLTQQEKQQLQKNLNAMQIQQQHWLDQYSQLQQFHAEQGQHLKVKQQQLASLQTLLGQTQSQWQQAQEQYSMLYQSHHQLQDKYTHVAFFAAQFHQVQDQYSQLINKHTQLYSQYTQLGIQYSGKEQQWLLQAAKDGMHLSQLKDNYSLLAQQYQRLIRPARSSADKYVVQVYYQKQHHKQSLSYNHPELSHETPISQAALEKALTTLKNKYADQLYVKIIFAQDAQVSHQDAWHFTQDILKKYDYYYQ